MAIPAQARPRSTTALTSQLGTPTTSGWSSCSSTPTTTPAHHSPATSVRLFLPALAPYGRFLALHACKVPCKLCHPVQLFLATSHGGSCMKPHTLLTSNPVAPNAGLIKKDPALGGLPIADPKAKYNPYCYVNVTWTVVPPGTIAATPGAAPAATPPAAAAAKPAAQAAPPTQPAQTAAAAAPQETFDANGFRR